MSAGGGGGGKGRVNFLSSSFASARCTYTSHRMLGAAQGARRKSGFHIPNPFRNGCPSTSRVRCCPPVSGARSFIQLTQLKNTLCYLRGEEQITHLGIASHYQQPRFDRARAVTLPSAGRVCLAGKRMRGTC